MTEDIKLEVIKMTQDTLGKYIKKPPLTEKLLKKPPFRFLHDVITATIRGTGFLSGLYSDTEMISENIKDRDMKIAFLQKLIDCVTIVIERKLDVRPSKIVAGLEPTKTNELLQAIGIAITKKLDSSSAVSKVIGEKNTVKKKTRTNDDKKQKHKSKESTDNRIKQSPSSNSTPKTKKIHEPKIVRKTSEDRANKIKESPRTKTNESLRTKTVKTKESPRTKIEKIQENHKVEKIVEKQEESKPESPKMSPKEEIIETKMETVSPVTNPEITQISPDISSEKLETSDTKPSTEKFAEEDVQKNAIADKKEILKPQKEVIARPKTSLRPPSVRPSSARPGAPRLKDRNEIILPPDEIVSMGKVNVIVENFSVTDEEETVVMEAPLEEISPPELPSIKSDFPAEKGHLVVQILEQIEDSEPQKKIEIEWESTGGKRNREIANREMEKLRQSIQTLTRAANPLGKLMNFLQEDVDSMRSELKMWIEINDKLSAEIKTQEKLNNDSITPLKTQLGGLDEEINKQHELISLTQANVLKNEQKIKILLNRN